ncbi:hypothetical protein [Clostridium hydrogeniformans]|uniref:hypothetical protein n=1 Tax=Clostridium hydrogeniformans TaxID=349933 RepID=UPI0004847FF4|nr:hypothetical protein [Clostridium hydrogeniformans]
MKKQSKKKLLIILILFFVIFIIKLSNAEANSIASDGVMSISKIFSRGSKVMVSSEIMDRNNNEIVFSSGPSDRYVNIMLESTGSKNVSEGLEFHIINPKGERVKTGILYDNETFREAYEGMEGQWKVIIYFENNNSSSMMKFGYNIGPKKENTMRIE